MIELGEHFDENLGTTHLGARISQKIEESTGFVLKDSIDYFAYGEGVEGVRLTSKSTFDRGGDSWKVATPWNLGQIATLEREGYFAQQVYFDLELERLEAVVFPRVSE